MIFQHNLATRRLEANRKKEKFAGGSHTNDSLFVTQDILLAKKLVVVIAMKNRKLFVGLVIVLIARALFSRR